MKYTPIFFSCFFFFFFFLIHADILSTHTNFEQICVNFSTSNFTQIIVTLKLIKIRRFVEISFPLSKIFQLFPFTDITGNSTKSLFNEDLSTRSSPWSQVRICFLGFLGITVNSTVARYTAVPCLCKRERISTGSIVRIHRAQ